MRKLIHKTYHNIKHRFSSKSIQKTALIIAIFTFASQLLSLIRDRLFANEIGTSLTLDIYYYAFKIPDILFAIFTSLVSVTVLIPLLVRYEKKDALETKKIYNILFSFFFIFSTVSIAILAFIMPYLVKTLVAPGVTDTEALKTITLYARLLLIQPFFLGLSNLLGSYTQMRERFLIYSLSPLVYNISIVLGLVFLYPIFGMIGVIYGVLIGSVIHAFIQIPFVKQNNFLPHFIFPEKKDFSAIKEVIFLSLPRAFILSLFQIKLLFFNSFASYVDAGNTSVLNFANNLQGVPMALIGVSFVVAAFPSLSKRYEEKDEKDFWHIVIYTMKKIIIYCGIITLITWFFKDLIIWFLLGPVKDAHLIALTLGIFTLSLIPQCIELLITRVYYARNNNLKPALLNIFLTIFVVGLAYFSNKTAVGIATAFSIGSWVSATVFIYSFRKELKEHSIKS